MVELKLIKLNHGNYEVLKCVISYLDSEIYKECNRVVDNNVGYIAHIVNMRCLTQSIINGYDYAVVSDDDFKEICELCTGVCKNTIIDEKFSCLIGR